MPIYEYECESCGNHTEAMQRFSDAPLTECGKCHGKLKRLISQSTFHLKGTGWYVTDYASKGGGGRGAAAKKETEGGGSKEGDAAKEGVKTGDKTD
jgi:putative FmdB family regulatory protein